MSRLLHALLLALLPATSLADVVLPDTPAGRAFSAFLDTINYADAEHQRTFLKDHPSWMTVESLSDWSAGTGGYELLEVSSSGPTNVFFHVKQKRWAVEEVGRLEVSAADPEALEMLGTWRMPAGARFQPAALDEAARARVIKFAAAAYESSYVDPGVGRQMAAALRKSAARGEYRKVRYGDVLASKLTQQLREVSHDQHVEVRFRYFAPRTESPTEQLEAESKWLASINCGFVKAEILPANIGYLKFDMFANPAVCAPTANAAMTFLADSDALIVDLRDNHGGNPEMALLVTSYLFDAPVHLADTYDRVDGSTKATWTLATVPGKRFIGKPAFVLTARGSFSAAEAVSFYLQDAKRATVVGETTAGGGHLTDDRRIDDHFSVRVPHASSLSPITKASWEGKGVQPDVKAPAGEALAVTLKLAGEAIRK